MDRNDKKVKKELLACIGMHPNDPANAKQWLVPSRAMHHIYWGKSQVFNTISESFI